MATKKVAVENAEKKRNVIDLLLGADTGKIKLPEKLFEVKRLSDILGEPFIVTLRAVSADKWEEIQDMALDISTNDIDVDTGALQTFTVMECVYDDEGNQLAKNKELMAKFGVRTPKDLVKALFLSGEITHIYSEVATLSGFSDDSIAEVKN